MTDLNGLKSVLGFMHKIGCFCTQLQWIDRSIPARDIASALDAYGIRALGVQDKAYAVFEDEDYYFALCRLTGAGDLCVSGAAEVGKKLYVITNNIPEDAMSNIVFKWYRLSSRSGDVLSGTLVASGTNEYTCVERDADNYIICVATNRAGSPYNISGRISTDSTVKQQSMSLWQRLLKWFYKVMASFTQLFGRI